MKNFEILKRFENFCFGGLFGFFNFFFNFEIFKGYAIFVTFLIGTTPSRRDDLISIIYILVYFRRGSLPWVGLDEKYPTKTTKELLDLQIKNRKNPGTKNVEKSTQRKKLTSKNQHLQWCPSIRPPFIRTFLKQGQNKNSVHKDEYSGESPLGTLYKDGRLFLVIFKKKTGRATNKFFR